MSKRSVKKLLNKVTRKIVPSKKEKERLEKLAKNLLELANKESKKYKAKAIIAGSLTRNTWLPGKMEFDLFILFPKSMSKNKMEKSGLKIGKKIIKKFDGTYRIEYAEHPYVSGEIDEMQIDVVPCYKLKSTKELKSSVDRTPFHVRYIEKKFPEKLSNDVRLLKKICVVNGIYGADTKTEGFSGYVCELIIINYGGFQKAIERISNWNHGEIVDIENFYNKSEYEEIRKKFKNQSLIIIDPTDRNRNAAAAISSKNFQKLKEIANDFRKSPSEKFFFPKKSKPIKSSELMTKIRDRGTELIIIKSSAPDVVPDILWPQLRKFSNRMESILKENEFDVLRKDVYTDEEDKIILVLEMENFELPNVRKRIGPSVFDRDGSMNFVKKYKKSAINGPFIDDDFWVVETKREYTTATEKIRDSLNVSLKILKAKGIPSHIAEEISKKYEMITNPKKIFKIVKNDRNFGVFLKSYFEKEKFTKC